MSSTDSRNPNPLGVLRQFSRQRIPKERCEFCGAELEDDHQHLLEPASRKLMCACDECAISVGELQGGKLHRIPRRVRYLADFQLDDAMWDSLLIPVGMAFFFYSSAANRMLAFYPSPAGATESLLDLESWEEVRRANPILHEMQPDVEALLVNRMKGGREYFLAPLDKCYELVGLIRAHWRGLSGGKEVWEEVNGFFAKLKRLSNAAGEKTHA